MARSLELYRGRSEGQIALERALGRVECKLMLASTAHYSRCVDAAV